MNAIESNKPSVSYSGNNGNLMGLNEEGTMMNPNNNGQKVGTIMNFMANKSNLFAGNNNSNNNINNNPNNRMNMFSSYNNAPPNYNHTNAAPNSSSAI